MLNLEDKEWKPFKVEELFSIYKCKCSKAGDLKKGNIPYIGATNRNNGLMSFVEKNEKLMTQGNCITFICDGQGSVGYSIYKYENFIGSTTLKIGRNHELNKYNGLFFTTSLDMNKSIYDYGYKRNDSRLKKETIIIPSINKKPDYKYMENYTKSIMDRKVEIYKKYIQNVLAGLEYKEIEPLENKEWKSFYIDGENGLFNITSTLSGIDKNKLIFSDNGQIPYITRTDINNGINLFISDDQLSKYRKNDGNVITIGLDTQTVFYQEHSFFTGQNIQVMKHNLLNKYNALFLIPLIKIQMEKFNWGGNGATLGRLARTKVMLPINENNEPDFEYMEQYSKNLMYKKIKQYLNYKNKEA